MKLKNNEMLTNFSTMKNLDLYVSHDNVLEIPNDLYSYCKSKGILTIDDLACEIDNNIDQMSREFGVDVDTLDEIYENLMEISVEDDGMEKSSINVNDFLNDTKRSWGDINEFPDV